MYVVVTHSSNNVRKLFLLRSLCCICREQWIIRDLHHNDNITVITTQIKRLPETPTWNNSARFNSAVFAIISFFPLQIPEKVKSGLTHSPDFIFISHWSDRKRVNYAEKWEDREKVVWRWWDAEKRAGGGKWRAPGSEPWRRGGRSGGTGCLWHWGRAGAGTYSSYNRLS